MSWNPEQYLKFSQPRLRPALDLLARVAADDPRSVYDLGCGTGNVTAILAKRWPRAALVGVDDSAAMLAQAAKSLPQVRWLQQNLADWQPDAPADVIFSNAALHWLPDHAQLLPALVRKLASGGVLALQMPRNFAAPSHLLIATTVRAGPWRSKLEPLLRAAPVAEPSAYYGYLASLAASLDIWESEYLQVLTGQDPVKEWTKGTWLTQFLQRLDSAESAAFEADYAQRLRSAYPPRADGSTLFPFRRLFIVLRKP
ncbi:MAG TPA: methyltransferase domain-containing protein [Steroidobacteraceae bacterium]|jgi:trans-aconitate 2-methyltransferase